MSTTIALSAIEYCDSFLFLLLFCLFFVYRFRFFCVVWIQKSFLRIRILLFIRLLISLIIFTVFIEIIRKFPTNKKSFIFFHIHFTNLFSVFFPLWIAGCFIIVLLFMSICSFYYFQSAKMHRKLNSILFKLAHILRLV